MTSKDKTAILNIAESLTDTREKLDVLCVMFAGNCDLQACASGLYTIANEMRVALDDVNAKLEALEEVDAE